MPKFPFIESVEKKTQKDSMAVYWMNGERFVLPVEKLAQKYPQDLAIFLYERILKETIDENDSELSRNIYNRSSRLFCTILN